MWWSKWVKTWKILVQSFTSRLILHGPHPHRPECTWTSISNKMRLKGPSSLRYPWTRGVRGFRWRCPRPNRELASLQTECPSLLTLLAQLLVWRPDSKDSFLMTWFAWLLYELNFIIINHKHLAICIFYLLYFWDIHIFINKMNLLKSWKQKHII